MAEVLAPPLSGAPAKPRASLRTSLLTAAAVAIGVAGLTVAILRKPVREFLGIGIERVERWPAIESLDLELDLSRPPEFRGRARIALSGVRERKLPLLLNRDLGPTAVKSSSGSELAWGDAGRLASSYHREARVVRVDLGREPASGGERVELVIDYGGRAADGSEQRDWRGILLCASDELRMSEQTVFHPAVPLSADGPGLAPARGSIAVLAPADFELFVPGREVDARSEPVPGARAWRFQFDEPTGPSVLGGKRVRSVLDAAGVRLVCLLRDAHAEQSDAILADARAALRFFSERFGPLAGQVFGIVEIQGRGDSYNWAGQGVAAFESGAFDERGLPADKLGHELAHLWWGQTVAARGEGERFLTEGLAEYSAWRWVEETAGADAARLTAREARESLFRAVHEHGSDPALAHVGFRTPGYNALAYDKGALVLRAAEASLGREAFDAGLQRYVEASRGKGGTLDALLLALYGSSEKADADLPWIRRDGHAHLAFREVERDEAGGWTRGRIEIAECPEKIASLAPPRIEARFAEGPDGVLACTFEPYGRAQFAVQALPDAIVLDEGVRTLATGELAHVLRPIAIVRSSPAQGARDVPYLTSRIELEFDRPLAPLPEKARSRLRSTLIEGARARSATWPSIGEPHLEQGGRLLVLELSQPLEPGREVAVVLDGALEDAQGIPLQGVALAFHTAPAGELDRPVVIRTSPEIGATGVDVALDEIRIEFSEPMRPGRGYSGTEVRELEQKGWKFPLRPRKSDSHWERGGRVLVYELTGELDPASRYILPLRGGFRDLAGNELADLDYTFETR